MPKKSTRSKAPIARKTTASPKRKNSSKKNSTLDASPMTGIFGMPTGSNTDLSMPFQMSGSASYYLISLQRIVLTYSYTIFGPLRTLVDQPIFDAFRGGVKVKSDQLSAEEMEDLNRELKKSGLVRATKNALRWDRLYGGAGVIVNTEQDYKKKLDPTKITEDSELEFIAADRWELAWQGVPGDRKSDFTYYGKRIHRSRVAKIIGEDAPALARERLQGWGMSVIECVIRELNSYFKHQNVTFELLDEAKVDVYKIKGFNASMLSSIARGKTETRLQIANQLKNFMNAIVLDKEDDYVTKNQSFAGMADILEQIRIGIAAAIRFPMAKIFGLAANGFDSGETDIENYNAIVENERDKAEEVLDVLVPVLCHKLFGEIPDDMKYEWKSLRTLKATEEEEVKSKKFDRLTAMRNSGHLNAEEYMRALKEESIFTMETEVGQGLVDPEENKPLFEGLGEDYEEIGTEEAPESQSSGKKPSEGKKPTEGKT